jgi:hypothetical protein
MSRALVIAALLAAGCPAPVDTSGLPSADGYADWADPIVTSGPVPGHGDTNRIIYVNELGRAYPHAGEYPNGTVLVKEIYDKSDSGAWGDLRYVALMRRIGDPAAYDVPADQLDEGWLFSEADEPGGDEVRLDLCWAKCHKAAPYHGAWLDYGY